MSGLATFRLGESDLIEAQRAWFNANLRAPMAAILAGALALVGAGILLLDPFPGRMAVALAALPAAGLIVAALLFLAPRWAMRRQARRIADQNRGLALEQTARWDGEGIEFSSSRGRGRLAWGELYRWQLTPTMLLLYPDETQFHALPLRALDPGAKKEIVSVLQSAGVPRRGRKQLRARDEPQSVQSSPISR